MAENEKMRALYDAASKKFKLGSYESFERNMQDEGKRKAFHEAASKRFKLGSYDDFNGKLGYGAAVSEPKSAVAAEGAAAPAAMEPNTAQPTAGAPNAAGSNTVGNNTAGEAAGAGAAEGVGTPAAENRFEGKDYGRLDAQYQMGADGATVNALQGKPLYEQNAEELRNEDVAAQEARANGTYPNYQMNAQMNSQRPAAERVNAVMPTIKMKVESDQRNAMAMNKLMTEKIAPTLDAAQKKIEADLQRRNENEGVLATMGTYTPGGMNFEPRKLHQNLDEQIKSATDAISAEDVADYFRFVYGVDYASTSDVEKAKMAKQLAGEIQHRMYAGYAEKNAPKNDLEYVMSSTVLNSLTGKLLGVLMGDYAGGTAPEMERQALGEGLNEYGKHSSEWLNVVAGFAPMAADAPLFAFGGYMMGAGAAGAGVSKAVTNGMGRTFGWLNKVNPIYNPRVFSMNGMGGRVANFLSRWAGGGVSTALTMLPYNVMSNALDGKQRGALDSAEMVWDSALEAAKTGFFFGGAGALGGAVSPTATTLRKASQYALGFGAESAYMGYEDLSNQITEYNMANGFVNEDGSLKEGALQFFDGDMLKKTNLGKAIGHGVGMALAFKLQHAIEHPKEFVNQFKTNRFASELGMDWTDADNDVMAMIYGENHPFVQYMRTGKMPEKVFWATDPNSLKHAVADRRIWLFDNMYKSMMADESVPMEQKRKMALMFENKLMGYGKTFGSARNEGLASGGAFRPTVEVSMNPFDVMTDMEQSEVDGHYVVRAKDRFGNVLFSRRYKMPEGMSEREKEDWKMQQSRPYAAALMLNTIRENEGMVHSVNDATLNSALDGYRKEHDIDSILERVENGRGEISEEDMDALTNYLDELDHVGQSRMQRSIDEGSREDGTVVTATDKNDAPVVVVGDEKGNDVVTINIETGDKEHTTTAELNNVEVQDAQEAMQLAAETYDPNVGPRPGNVVDIETPDGLEKIKIVRVLEDGSVLLEGEEIPIARADFDELYANAQKTIAENANEAEAAAKAEELNNVRDNAPYWVKVGEEWMPASEVDTSTGKVYATDLEGNPIEGASDFLGAKAYKEMAAAEAEKVAAEGADAPAAETAGTVVEEPKSAETMPNTAGAAEGAAAPAVMEPNTAQPTAETAVAAPTNDGGEQNNVADDGLVRVNGKVDMMASPVDKAAAYLLGKNVNHEAFSDAQIKAIEEQIKKLKKKSSLDLDEEEAFQKEYDDAKAALEGQKQHWQDIKDAVVAEKERAANEAAALAKAEADAKAEEERKRIEAIRKKPIEELAGEELDVVYGEYLPRKEGESDEEYQDRLEEKARQDLDDTKNHKVGRGTYRQRMARAEMLGVDFDNADPSLTAASALANGVKFTPESMQQELGGMFGEGESERLKKNTADEKHGGRSIAQWAHDMMEDGRTDGNGAPLHNESEYMDAMIEAMGRGGREENMRYVESLIPDNKREEDMPTYWTPRRAKEYSEYHGGGEAQPSTAEPAADGLPFTVEETAMFSKKNKAKRHRKQQRERAKVAVEPKSADAMPNVAGAAEGAAAPAAGAAGTVTEPQPSMAVANGGAVAEPNTAVEKPRSMGDASRHREDAGLERDAHTESLDKKMTSLIDAIAKRLGIHVSFRDKVAGGNANAQYLKGTRQVDIEKGNENPVKFLFGHEMLHHVRETDKATDSKGNKRDGEAYNAFAKTAKHVLGDTEFNARVKKKQDLYGSNKGLAEEEVVSDFAGEMLENTKAAKRFTENAPTGVLEKMKRFFEDVHDILFGSTKELYSDVLVNSMKEVEDIVSKEIEFQKEALNEEGGTMLSNKDEKDKKNTGTSEDKLVSGAKSKESGHRYAHKEGAVNVKGTSISSESGAKILNNLEEAKKTYSKIDAKGRDMKGFLPYVSSLLGIYQERNKPNKKYKTFVLDNGTTVTIRVGGHNSAVSNFDRNGEFNALSIVISPQRNRGIKNDGNAHVIEYFYPIRDVLSFDGKAKYEIISSILDSLKSGTYKDNTGVAKMEEVNYSNPKYREMLDDIYMAHAESGDDESAEAMLKDAVRNLMPETKVVGENGEPMVVYHGASLEEFYTKDGHLYTRYIDRFNTFRPGNGFFTPDKEAAETFGSRRGQYAVYLNMKNPFVFDCNGQSWDEIKDYKNDDNYRYVTTDYIVKDIMRKGGYDGVILKNVSNENSGRIKRTIDDYIPFESNQIKSAESITRDDNGNVIPLSKRFDAGNDDIRFSLKKASEEYAKAVEDGDTDKAQKLVEDAAVHAGYRINAEHGTTNSFTVFDKDRANAEGNWGKGFYFSNDEYDVERNYANNDGADLTNRIERLAESLEYEDGFEDASYEERKEEARKRLSEGEPRIIQAALKMDNPVVFGNKGNDETFFDAEGKYDEEVDEYQEPEGRLVDFIETLQETINDMAYGQSDLSPLWELVYDGGAEASRVEKVSRDCLAYVEGVDGELIGSEILREAFERMGFDGIVDNNVSDKFKNMGLSKNSTHYIVFHPEQIKSTDPITYDNDGKVIPLSERFNDENDDIRYSLKPENGESMSDFAKRVEEAHEAHKVGVRKWKMEMKPGETWSDYAKRLERWRRTERQAPLSQDNWLERMYAAHGSLSRDISKAVESAMWMTMTDEMQRKGGYITPGQRFPKAIYKMDEVIGEDNNGNPVTGRDYYAKMNEGIQPALDAQQMKYEQMKDNATEWAKDRLDEKIEELDEAKDYFNRLADGDEKALKEPMPMYSLKEKPNTASPEDDPDDPNRPGGGSRNPFVRNRKKKALANMFRTYALDEMDSEVVDWIESNTDLFKGVDGSDSENLEYILTMSETQWNKMARKFKDIYVPGYGEFKRMDADEQMDWVDDIVLKERGVREELLSDEEWLDEHAGKLVDAIEFAKRDADATTENDVRARLGLDDAAGVSGGSVRINLDALDEGAEGARYSLKNERLAVQAVDDMRDEIADMMAKQAGKKNDPKALKALVDDLTKFVNGKVNKAVGGAMDSTRIKGILSQIDAATSHQDLEQPVRDIQMLLNDAVSDVLAKRMHGLMNTQLQSKNQRGVATAVAVDETVRGALQNVRENQRQTRAQMEADYQRDEQDYNDMIANGEPVPDDLMMRMTIAYPIREMRVAIDEQRVDLETARNDWESAVAAIYQIRRAPGYMAQRRQQRVVAQAAQDLYIQKQHEYNLAVNDFNENVGGVMGLGADRLSAWRKAKTARKKLLVHEAMGDVKYKHVPLEGEPGSTLENRTAGQKISDGWKAVKSWSEIPMQSLNFMLQMVDQNHANKEGFLYKHFFLDPKTSVVAANDNMAEGREAFGKELIGAVERIFGMKPSKTDNLTGKNAYVRLTEDGRKELGTPIVRRMTKGEAASNNKHQVNGRTDWQEGEDFEVKGMTKGHALYLWLTWRQPDGKMKMAQQGYDDAAMQQIEQALGQKYIQFGEWVTDEFLPRLRKERYNERHVEMYGTSMAENPHYFPLKLDRDKIAANGEFGQPKEQFMPSTITPNIIKRSRNNIGVDADADALEILQQYGNVMEQWYNMAPVIEEFNTLHASPAFRKAMEANQRGSFNMLMQAAQVATGSLYENVDYASRAVEKVLNKSISAGARAAIGFRFMTAGKQIFSYPAFYAYSANPRYLGELSAIWLDMVGNHKWAMENMPSYRQRVRESDMGMEGLGDRDTWGTIDRMISKLGMAANRKVDQLTVAAGARAVYRQAMRDLTNQGYSPQEAHDRAVLEAEICYNESQQSSRNEFSSRMQKSASAIMRPLTLFQNANIGYARQIRTALWDMQKAYRRHGKDAFMQKVWWKSAASVGIFGGVLHLVWQMAGNTNTIPAMLNGNLSDEEKQGYFYAWMMGMLTNGTTLGAPVSSFMNGYGISQTRLLDSMNDLIEVKRRSGLDSSAFWGKVAEGIAQAGFGVSFDTWKNIGNAVVDLCTPSTYGSETLAPDLALDIMLLMNMSKTDRGGWANRMYAKYGAVKMSQAYEKAKQWERSNQHNTEIAKNYVRNIDADFEKEMTRLMAIDKQYRSLDTSDEEAEEILKNEPMLETEGIFYDYKALLDEIKSNIKEQNDTDLGAMSDADIRKAMEKLVAKWKGVTK